MAPKKSVFRQPGARHFQLVHRSQRDPLIHDPEASQHVLKPFERENVKKGKSRAELESYLSPSDLAHDLQRPNIGEAALYGIYYDDTEYDYMQHLKQAGVQEEGVESVLIEAPQPPKAKGKGKVPIQLRDLPAEALPSTSELPRNYDSLAAVPSSIAGFQPDMDPHLRQALEALEDDAFVDEGLEDDFFAELVAEGERDETEPFEYEFKEDGLEEGEEVGEAEEEDQSWEARFKQFKISQKQAGPPTDPASEFEDEEDRDTVSGLPQIAVIGGKRRRKKTSDASGYSMSSSSMFRNEHLSVLDERFDAIEREYGSDDDFDDAASHSSSSDEAPQLITSREDFESMLDEFLTDYEILGNKMKHVLSGDTAAEKLDTLRRAMGQDDRVRVEQGADAEEEEPREFTWFAEEKEDKWDCETILSTYSNLENHPRMISARTKSVPKIRLDPRTGLPSVQEKPERKAKPPKEEVDDDSDLTENERIGPVRVTVVRTRNESKEEKKARKQAVKAERRTRRAEKKSTKEEFSNEIKQQTSRIAQKGNSARMRKL
ncbi:LTV-domain-containing protein [Gloeophyllum trabeum ATCC 11539]|uniref:LTV-domain-containing protein n=1 Tax=Gloeophyllum trabeum (strain ATCC 11539 / FP-39264 / Madison 617) TaxID=670483 RepID=S7QK73_GLOTA|nr:LTV-domain-containing protein [Gloeophyllum trabeum ATCC 11539]EPQ60146.1 LTV-domain-containing protein [Gloeophyllum trabeum ATCC 11539]